jgi:catechol 2,3-dioxygenase-like lactoylglutathione lyase family enzyme
VTRRLARPQKGAAKGMVKGINQVVIEVQDQDRALAFWTATLGFELVQDAPYGEDRWIEVRTSDKAPRD